jgi:hypothetical protein
VRKEFNSLKGFETINMTNLFYEENKAAFNIALQNAIGYNNKMLEKSKLHTAITTQKTNLKPTEKKKANTNMFKDKSASKKVETDSKKDNSTANTPTQKK